MHLRKLLARQGGAVTYRQIEDALGRKGFDLWKRQGKVTRLRHGIYTSTQFITSIADDPVARHALDLAAVLLAAPGGAASHSSAARVYGYDFVGPEPEDLHVTYPPRAGRAPVQGTRTHFAELPADQVNPGRATDIGDHTGTDRGGLRPSARRVLP